MDNKTYVRILIAAGIIGFFLLLYVGSAKAATVCQIANGCTGTGTAPTYGKVLVGGQNGEYEFVATSTFGSAGGSGTVTSVGLSSPNSTLTVGSTPVTTSGTITADINLATSDQWTASTTFTKIVNLANASSSLNTFGTVWIPAVLSALHLADSSGKITAYAGTSCSNQFVRSLNGAGVATCNSVSLSSDVNGTLGLTNGGTNASLSGANGLIAMNSGNTALSIPSTGYTLTSSLLTAPNASTTNFTASSFFEAPTTTSAPSFTLSGELEVNTNSVASSSISFGAASQNNNVFAVSSGGFWISSSTLAITGAIGASGTTTKMLVNDLHSSTLNSFYCITDSGTVWLGFGTGSATTTEVQCTTSGASSGTLSSNNTWHGRQTVFYELGHTSSFNGGVTVTYDVEDSN